MIGKIIATLIMVGGGILGLLCIGRALFMLPMLFL
ncbi:hypothetical protein L284_06425 [Novosphingobium lindaniclasticum LE124]|uniref:Uncharacterized protein n=1 Tax=Novosphingobium lindaniclasticum LE124 TaxID=1096930 RepID=T0HN95_9SPHN|nr:hypothetical protein L284_06425 [Novosphingobium lindaniclasticum LE124]